ncbi:phage baseplate assembly protein V [Cellulomonas sp. CW35]|uniref:phage baseplate assembly protein V n=1 Tax=Cellulomonas sp. CW35 TaxID=3458249 RepID=UPI004033257A
MTDVLYDAVARIARHEADARSWVSVAVVTEVHTTAAGSPDHSVSVRLRDTAVVVPRVPVAVGALGFVATPAVDDLVVVAFADGDPHAGVVVGRLYHRDLAPPEHGDGKVVLQLPPGGKDVDLQVDASAPQVTLVVGDTSIELAKDRATLTIGDCEVVVDGASPGGVTLTAKDSTLTLGGNGEVSLEASTRLTLKAPEVVIDGSSKVTVSGGLVEVN